MQKSETCLVRKNCQCPLDLIGWECEDCKQYVAIDSDSQVAIDSDSQVGEPLRVDPVVGRSDELDRIWDAVQKYPSFQRHREMCNREGCNGMTTILLDWIDQLVEGMD